MSDSFTHLDERGTPRMVDVGSKTASLRRAVAEGFIRMEGGTLSAILEGSTKKGNVLTVAEVAAISGAKQTSSLIPLCHPIALSSVEVSLEPDPAGRGIRATVSTEAVDRTGVEMEALTAVAVALLTIYDMCKSMDRGMRIEGIRLVRKEGGRSGLWTADPQQE